MLKALAVASLLSFSSFAQAGIFELGATYNYKKTYFDQDHLEAQESGTASLAYYFWEMSALELSFTRGAAVQTVPDYDAYQDVTAYGVNFLITMANRDSPFKPYVKAGGAYIVKNLRIFYKSAVPLPPTAPTIVQGIAPTGGLGFKMMIGQQFALKAGVDVSAGPIGSTDSSNFDFGATGGISFLF